jgi:hypothetical protein
MLTGHMGTSGVHVVQDPSPSLDPRSLGEVDAKDKTRQTGVAALALAMDVANEMCSAARAAHNDPNLSVADRHRTAAARAANAALSFRDAAEKTRAIYERELSELRKKIDGPTGNFHEIEIGAARSKLADIPQVARFARIKKAIDEGSDLIIAVITRSDAFLNDFLTEAEQEVLINHWRQSRFPEQFARFKRLETDVAILESDARILQNYEISIANPAIVANGIPPSAITWGAPGPAPKITVLLLRLNSGRGT